MPEYCFHASVGFEQYAGVLHILSGLSEFVGDSEPACDFFFLFEEQVDYCECVVDLPDLRVRGYPLDLRRVGVEERCLLECH